MSYRRAGGCQALATPPLRRPWLRRASPMRQYRNMRHLITRLIIMSVLLANMAWLADMYLIDQMSGPAPMVIADGHGQNECPPCIDCHHCCHASVHLVTLPSDGLPLNPIAPQQLSALAQPVLHSFIPAPPYQPPRA